MGRQCPNFRDLPAGRYAAEVVHCETEDDRLNRAIYPLLGMPEEP